jgi:sec-independent protein translocase protein TatA
MISLNVLFGYGPLSSPLALAVILLIALVLFGNRLPSMMRSLGRSVVEFKKGVAGIEDEVNDAVKNPPKNNENTENKNNESES